MKILKNIHQEHTQYAPNTFCKIIIRYAAIDAARMLHLKWKREISLEWLSEEKQMHSLPQMNIFHSFRPVKSICSRFAVRRSYFAIQTLPQPCLLLPEMEQESIFLYFFQRLP